MNIIEIKNKMTEALENSNDEYAFFVGSNIWKTIKEEWEKEYTFDCDLKELAWRGYRIYKVEGFYEDRIFFGKAYIQ